MLPDGPGCIKGGNDGEMKVWSIDVAGLYKFLKQVDTMLNVDIFMAEGYSNTKAKPKLLWFHFPPDCITLPSIGPEGG